MIVAEAVMMLHTELHHRLCAKSFAGVTVSQNPPRCPQRMKTARRNQGTVTGRGGLGSSPLKSQSSAGFKPSLLMPEVGDAEMTLLLKIIPKSH